MTKSTFFIITLSALAFFAFLTFRSCTGCGMEKPKTETTVETDTTTQEVAGPEITPLTDQVEVVTADDLTDKGHPGIDVSFLQSEIKRYKKRYLFYKAETKRLRDQLIQASNAISAAPDCDEREDLYKNQIAALKEKVFSDENLIKELIDDNLNNSQLSIYTGKQDTPNFSHEWEINVLGGTLPPNGYKFKTDVKQNTVTKTVTVTKSYHKRNTMMPFAGLQTTPDGFRPLYGLGYTRSNNTLGLTLQGGYLPADGAKTAQGQVNLGLNVHF